MLLCDLYLEADVDDACCLTHTCIGDLLHVLAKNYDPYQAKANTYGRKEFRDRYGLYSLVKFKIGFLEINSRGSLGVVGSCSSLVCLIRNILLVSTHLSACHVPVGAGLVKRHTRKEFVL